MANLKHYAKVAAGVFLTGWIARLVLPVILLVAVLALLLALIF